MNADWVTALGKNVLRFLCGTQGIGLVHRNYEDGYTTGTETSEFDGTRGKCSLRSVARHSYLLRRIMAQHDPKFDWHGDVCRWQSCGLARDEAVDHFVADSRE